MKTLKNFSQSNKILYDLVQQSDFKVLAYFNDELTTVISNAPFHDNKEIYIHKFLDDFFYGTRFDSSFYTKNIIIIDECTLPEIILALHSWFRKQCCKISNIVLISTGTTNLNNWYQSYCKLNLEPGFTIIEFFIQYYFDRLLANFKPIKDVKQKKLNYYFSCYGGTYGSIERDFIIATAMLYQNLGYIDYNGGYVSTLDEFDGFLEQVTEFQNRDLCDRLIKSRNLYEWPKPKNIVTESQKDNFVINLNLQNQESAFQLVRETTNQFAICSVTEKTYKSFLDCQLILPIGYNAVNNLKYCGFLFDENLIDYSYQQEMNFAKRLLGALKQIERISLEFNLSQLSERIYNSKEILLHNYNFIASGDFVNKESQKLVKILSE